MGIFGLKIAMCLIFMKFGSQSKSNMLIMNISIGIDDLDPNFGPTIEVLNDFMRFAAPRTNGIFE